MEDFSIYRYYKGENNNPFDRSSQNSEYIFWEHEKRFNDMFESKRFTEDYWGGVDDEWAEAFREKDKSGMFKVWLFRLFDKLADSSEMTTGYFSGLYWGNQ